MENGEIDLIDLYRAFKKTSGYRLVNGAFKFIFNNKIWFTAFIVIGLAAGFYINTTKEPFFKSEMLVDSKEIDNYVSKNIIATLNPLIVEKNYDELQKKGINKNFAEEIVNLKFAPFNIQNTKAITFKIELFTYNNKNLNEIEEQLIYFLNNTKHSKHVNSQNMKYFTTEKNNLLDGIKELDHLSFLIKNQLKSDQKIVYTAPSTITNEKLQAQIRINELNKLISNCDNYQVLNGFTPANSSEPVRGNYPLKLSFLSFIMGFFILRIFKK